MELPADNSVEWSCIRSSLMESYTVVFIVNRSSGDVKAQGPLDRKKGAGMFQKRATSPTDAVHRLEYMVRGSTHLEYMVPSRGRGPNRFTSISAYPS